MSHWFCDSVLQPKRVIPYLYYCLSLSHNFPLILSDSLFPPKTIAWIVPYHWCSLPLSHFLWHYNPPSVDHLSSSRDSDASSSANSQVLSQLVVLIHPVFTNRTLLLRPVSRLPHYVEVAQSWSLITSAHTHIDTLIYQWPALANSQTIEFYSHSQCRIYGQPIFLKSVNSGDQSLYLKKQFTCHRSMQNILSGNIFN